MCFCLTCRKNKKSHNHTFDFTFDVLLLTPSKFDLQHELDSLAAIYDSGKKNRRSEGSRKPFKENLLAFGKT